MKVVILAGGYGTRIGEETAIRPKPMVEIGDKPILWHIMKHYSSYGFNEFVILLGYKGSYIKQYFADYFLNSSSVEFDLQNQTMKVIQSEVEPWKVTLLDTGINTLTGGRILRAKDIIKNEPFLLTYGDGVSDINILELVQFHKKEKRIVTMSAVQPEGRFGSLYFDSQGQIHSFKEKSKDENGWINGGFFVCEPSVFEHITEGDKTIFERSPLDRLVHDNQLSCYRHHGFWKCMDTLADKNTLENLWNSGKAKWKVW